MTNPDPNATAPDASALGNAVVLGAPFDIHSHHGSALPYPGTIGATFAYPTTTAPGDWINVVRRTATIIAETSMTAEGDYDMRASGTVAATAALTATARTRQKYSPTVTAATDLSATLRMGGAVYADALIQASSELTATASTLIGRSINFTATPELTATAKVREFRSTTIAATTAFDATNKAREIRSADMAVGAGLTATAMVREIRQATIDATATLSPTNIVIKDFAASGMNKSSNYTLPSLNTWHTVPSWTVRADYPDTVITTDGILVPNGVEVTISGQLTWGATDSFSGNTMRMRVMAGTTQLATANTGSNSSVSALAPFTWKNETGAPALVTVQAYSTSSSFSRNVVTGGVNSFLTVVPIIPLVLRASDGFDRPNGALGSNWVTTGGGTLNIVDGHLNGVGTPSVPLSYAWWHEPMPSDTQVVRAVVRWDGYDPEHSACGVVVRANPNGTPTAPGRQFGVQFSWTRSIMALYYEDFNAQNGFTPVTGVAAYVNTSKFPEGALIELRAEGNLYTARMNGTIMLQGTVPTTVIPFSNRWVGLTIQDDSAVSGGGGPPGRLDDFQALTP